MPNYRRRYAEGGVYFLTLVTHQRRNLFWSQGNRRFLRHAFVETRRRKPFEVVAIVLLPNHLHMLMGLPPADADYPGRISKIKRNFTEAYLAAGGQEAPATPGRQRQRYRGVWQMRYWEHTIRDARDLAIHTDYIHVNPVKHGLVQWPRDWPWSSFHRYVRLGYYDPDWCGHVELPGTTYAEPEGL